MLTYVVLIVIEGMITWNCNHGHYYVPVHDCCNNEHDCSHDCGCNCIPDYLRDLAVIMHMIIVIVVGMIVVLHCDHDCRCDCFLHFWTWLQLLL